MEKDFEQELNEIVEEASKLDPLEGLEKLRGVEIRKVALDLDDQTLLKAGDRAAELYEEMAKLEKKKKDTAKQIQGDIDNLKPEFNTLMELISERVDKKDVQCERYLDQSTNEICYVYDGKIVDTSEASDDDKQLSLIDDQCEPITNLDVAIKKEDITLDILNEFEDEIIEAQVFIGPQDSPEFQEHSVQEDNVQQVAFKDNEGDLLFYEEVEDCGYVVVYKADTEEEKVRATKILKSVMGK